MTTAVLTPITQALNEGALTRQELKALMRRSNWPAFRRLAVWIVALCVTGTLVWLSMGTWLVWPAMFVHGILMVHHFSLQHECVHYTPFKTRWLNDVAGNACGFIIALPHQYFRYEHCDHHTHTQLKGYDPELIELPISLWNYLWYISSVPYWSAKIKEFSRHIAGRMSDGDKVFVPKEAYNAVFWEARIMAGLYAAILILCIATGWWAPLWYWWLPVLLGEPVMRWIRLTEHVGRPNVRDMRENTRTNLISAPLAFLSWNMNYHAEHHYAASVPFHALPKLHKKLEGYVYVEPRGYLGAHIDIISQLIGRRPRSDKTQEQETAGA
ncbi:MAG: fatty acid desaturase [Confluentimicrobium sp.]|uniref:fatty acid desaturase family protein n=1 Tax=Actibacterium sp. TaxID=1872125 RepID=UPI00068DD96E|nr:fatty acid desaturase family protein [Actibacterium sp.]MBC57200.1 fatty acid desaturase [Actibacterium sp.]MDY6859825.1 fatty acid desaturase family protein [Pseudomonadota bacterium]